MATKIRFGRHFSKMAVRIQVGDPCICWNEDCDKFRWYRDYNGKVCGKFCLECHTEWLPRKYLPTNTNEDVLDAPPGSEDTDVFYLFSSEPQDLEENTAFLIRPSRTEIDPNHFADVLKPGDHVTWHRRYGLWHHAIVSKISPDDGSIDVIEWTKKDCWIKIFESTLKIISGDNSALFNQLYRVDYPKETTHLYDAELVLARARSRIRDTGYQPFIDNCETFATYCKTGSAKSHQVEWMKAKLKECIGENAVTVVKSFVKGGCRAASKVVRAVPKSAGEVIPAELIEEITNTSDLVGAGIVIGLETYFVVCDLTKVYTERTNGDTGRKVFLEAALRRVVEGLVTTGFTVTGSIGVEFALGSFAATPFGPIGVLMCGIAGGIISGSIGRVIGTWLGSVTGKIVAVQFQDDRVVKDISELEPGDHIVLCGWCLHPRCHAILVKHNEKDTITVIRNTYEHGVVEESLAFDVNEVLYKVHYEQDACLDAKAVLRNAWSKLGHYKYNIVTYNCKSFAVECKTTTPDVVIIPDVKGIALDENKLDL